MRLAERDNCTCTAGSDQQDPGPRHRRQFSGTQWQGTAGSCKTFREPHSGSRMTGPVQALAWDMYTGRPTAGALTWKDLDGTVLLF